MKDKNVAGILGLFLGGFGAHWFYLGRPGLGFLHLAFMWTPVPWISGLISALIFFTIPPERFQERFVEGRRLRRRDYTRRSRPDYDYRRPDTDYNSRPRQRYFSHQKQMANEETRKALENRQKSAPHKKKGIELFKEFDYPGAIASFGKALEFDPQDPATNFNIACAYSLMENADKAFEHLDRAVRNGFDDFQKIKAHDSLAYLRIQDEFDTFERNGFTLSPKTGHLDAPEDDLLSSQPDLLDQLKKLGELKENGILSEEEFIREKKKLLG